MEDEMIFESLDCLWFYSNILSSPPHPPPPSQPVLIQPSNLKLGEDPNTNTLVDPIQASPKSDCFEMSEVTDHRKKKRSGEQSKKISYKLHEEEIEEAKKLMCIISTSVKCKAYNYENGCRVQVSCDLALKKQLRSWAHAVACTVK